MQTLVLDVVAFSLNFLSIDPDPSLIGGCLVALMSEINREVGAFFQHAFPSQKRTHETQQIFFDSI